MPFSGANNLYPSEQASAGSQLWMIPMVFSAAEKLEIAKMAMAPRVILRLLLWKLITLSPSMVSLE
jgi:hypothetical protein